MALPAWDQWTGLRLRVMSSAGSQLAIWQPAASVHPVAGPEVTYPDEIIERQTTAGDDASVIKGVRPTVDMTLQTLAGHFAGAGLTSSLEDVIAMRLVTAGSYYELALHEVTTDVFDYKKVRLVGGFRPQSLPGGQPGLQVRLELVALALQKTMPPRDSESTYTGAAW